MIRIITGVSAVVGGRASATSGIGLGGVSRTRTVTAGNVQPVTGGITVFLDPFVAAIRRNAVVLIMSGTIAFGNVAVVMGAMFVKDFGSRTAGSLVIKFVSELVDGILA